MKNFTAKQKEIIARKLGYDGPMQGFDEFVQSSPALAMKYEMINDKYTERMNKGGAVMRYQDGGAVMPGMVDNKEQDAANASAKNADIVAKVRERFPDYNPDRMTMDYGPADEYYGELLRGGTADQGKKRITPANREQEISVGVQPNQYATGTAATDDQIAALYRQVLGREPDAGGLQFYKQSGFSPEQIKEQLTLSPEYKGRAASQYATGTAATDDQIASLYRELLGREADAGGLQFYKQSGFSPEQIREQLTLSPEYKSRTASQYATGTRATDDQIAALYRQVLGREPDAGGLQFYKQSGFSPEQIREQLTLSPEYKGRSEAERAQQYATGTAASRDQIATLYRELLDREPDAGGLQFYDTSNFSIDQIRQEIMKSDEYKNKPKKVSPTQYSATGVPQVGSVAQATAAQTAITPDMKLDASKYQAPAAAPQAVVTTAQTAAPVTPQRTQAATMTAVRGLPVVQEIAGAVKGITGQAPTIDAAQLTPEQMQASLAQAQQLERAQQVQLAQRQLQAGEIVSGPAVDMARAEQAIAQTQAAQGRVTEDMTVQGQLTKLTANFDASNPPPWAAGAIRSVTAQLAARGLSASSMAGQAVVQAALEMAVPIASADAAVYQQMEAQNLSNRQQVAILSAQQRAQFLGQEFDQTFQTRVLNAAKIADIANMNFSAEQQVYLENARLAQSVDLANLNNRQAAVIANAATIANMQMANLSARQQTAVANAQNFLQMNLANMSNEQQAMLFKAQALSQAVMSDTAAENAARQFNAANAQQSDQFNSQLATQASQFNAAQYNAIQQFNAGQTNALAQFNAQMDSQRQEFNTRNRIIIDQANAQLIAQISTANTAATNAANFQNAQAMNNMTLAQYNNEVQLYRDQVKMVFDSYERAEDRAASMATAVLQAELAREKISAETSAAFGKLVGSVVGTKVGEKVLDGAVDFVRNLFIPKG